MTAQRARGWGAWPYYLVGAVVLALLWLTGQVVVMQYAPRFTPDLAKISIGTFPDYVVVPGQRLTCGPSSKRIVADCRVPFEGQELHVVIMGSNSSLGSCRATYAGATISCKTTGYHYTPDLKPGASISDTLGVSRARLAVLRLRNPWSHMGEGRWLLLVLGLCVGLAGLSVLTLRQVPWRWPTWILVGVATGVFLMLLRFMGGGLLSLGIID